MNRITTEKEWLASKEANRIVRYSKDSKRPASDRKFRLIEVAYARRLWHLMDAPESQEAVLVAERFADGLARKTHVALACARAEEVYRELHGKLGHNNGKTVGALIAFCVVWGYRHPWENTVRTLRNLSVYRDAHDLTREEEAELARDVLGNPFQRVQMDSSWQSSTVQSLAETIYEERPFDLLPVLADALEEAGCDDARILDHCRGSGPHVRGCWVLDLLLGKE